MTAHPLATVAVMSGSGGLGKTVTALTIAGTWAERGDVVLVDADDTKEAGTATDWLDRAEPAATDRLSWASADRDGLVAALANLPRPVVIDTPPGLRGAESLSVAHAVDAVLVVGSVDEMREVIQAAQSITSATDTPVAAVLTRTHPATDASALGQSVRQALGGVGLEVVGSLRRYTPLERAKLGKQLPFTVSDPRVVADRLNLVKGLDRWLTKVVSHG